MPLLLSRIFRRSFLGPCRLFLPLSLPQWRRQRGKKPEIYKFRFLYFRFANITSYINFRHSAQEKKNVMLMHTLVKESTCQTSQLCHQVSWVYEIMVQSSVLLMKATDINCILLQLCRHHSLLHCLRKRTIQHRTFIFCSYAYTSCHTEY